MSQTPKRAAVYCRLSYAPDGSVEKVERQEADCRELAARLGWEISESHVFVDNSRSAWQRKRKRPGWDSLLKAVEADDIDGIVVYHGDRMIRQPFDLERMISLAEGKGLRISSPSGTRDLDSADDRFILRIEAAQACRASDDTSRRVSRGVKGRVEKGLPPTAGGKRPYGWGVQIGSKVKVDPETGKEKRVPVFDMTLPVAEEIRFTQRAIERQLAGMNHGAVVRWLNESGSRTTEGNPWTTKSWRNVVLRPRVAGLIEHGGKLHKAAWDGAVSVEVWAAIKALYAASAAESPYCGRERVHLLTGVAECFQCHPAPRGGKCGSPKCKGPHQAVRSKPSGGRNRKTSRIYYCPSCRGVGRNMALLDAYIDGRVLRLLSSEDFLRELRKAMAPEGGDASSLLTEITALEKRREQEKARLESLADHPDVDGSLVVLAIASFDRKIVALRARLAVPAKLNRLTKLVGIGREDWLARPIDVRSAVVKDLFRVVILPTELRGPGFDTSSVRLERRPL
ncbi:recombinase family protein [Streptomyces sp. SID13726]|uniref:recombinase family protein n=1 Tax=Streptomyces sp. SID13726 TaxID=2706058 RepID=UPI0013BC4D01|nr:recombinase family protein [Streptomyces sp. SID13726]NEB00642.1 recombinase family protein [Streptomyces sp. SID13726]